MSGRWVGGVISELAVVDLISFQSQFDFSMLAAFVLVVISASLIWRAGLR